MPELVYQLYWQLRVRRNTRLTLIDGRQVEILNPGIPNRNAGPDFFAAHIRIDNREWSGNIEIHVRASDWLRHRHHTDPAYASVILHAVGISDRQIPSVDGSPIPQTVITPEPEFAHAVKALSAPRSGIRCAAAFPGALAAISPLHLTDWMAALAVERLDGKAARIITLLNRNAGDWRRATFITLARALGFGTNADPMETLASSLNLNTLDRHSSSPFQLRALILGQAGLLNTPADKPLLQEYNFLRTKYSLTPPGCIWKPARVPVRQRIEWLIAIVTGSLTLPAPLLDAVRPDGTVSLTDVYNALKGPHSTKAALNLLVINLVAPLYHAYGTLQGNPRMLEAAHHLLETLPPEQNTHIAAWTRCGLRPGCALASQALLHLYTAYCLPARCRHCRFPARFLAIVGN